MDMVKDNYYKNETRLMFKTILLVCGLIGFILTCSEVESYGKFNEFYLEANDLDLSKIVKNLWIKYTYKAIMIFVILTRKYTWHLYIVIYFLLLCSILINSKKMFMLWLYLSAIRSLFINVIIVLTGLWLGFITSCNKWTLLDFFLFKIIEIGFSTFFWCVLWTVHWASVIPAVHGRRVPRKRRASFHGFRRRGRVSLNTVRRIHSSVFVVRRNNVTEKAKSVQVDHSPPSSNNLSARAEKSVQVSSEELANSSKLKSTQIIKSRYWRDTLLRIQQLPIDSVNMDLPNEKLEEEINEVGTSDSRKKSFQKDQNESSLTLEALHGIFYKYHGYKPITTVKKSSDES